jgi:hypothetical protein
MSRSERSMADRAGPIGEVLRLALVEDALNDRKRLLDAAKVVAPHPDARNRSGGRFSGRPARARRVSCQESRTAPAAVT